MIPFLFYILRDRQVSPSMHGSLGMTMIVNTVPTGIPKPLVYTNEFSHRILNAMYLSAPDGHISLPEKLQRGCFFTMLPAFHVRPFLAIAKFRI